MSFRNFTSKRSYLTGIRTFFTLLTLCCTLSFISAKAQKADLTLIDYVPAPGQFINTPGIGTPEGAQETVENKSGLVTLGSFGGYVTFKLNDPVYNDAQHPYGVDFIVFGNAFTGSAEPGIVMVQKDDNGNGLPDGQWYELAGSDYYFSSTKKNYEITFTNPGGTEAQDVPWTDNFGGSGAVKANSFHKQPYYPTAEFFPSYPQDQMSFTGTLVASRTYQDESSGIWYNGAYRYGYCDNTPSKSNGDLSIPSNPYGEDATPGAGGDGFDISWAVDAEGNRVALDRIDFVRIYTSSNTDAGVIGEVSTEFAYLSVVAKNAAIQGETRAVVMAPVPRIASAGENVQIEALAFDKGIPSGKDIKWVVDQPDVASIDENGVLTVIGNGLVHVEARLKEDESVKEEVAIQCAFPGGITIEDAFTQAFVDVKQELKAVAKDADDQIIEDAVFTYQISPEGIAEIVEEDGNTYFKGIQPGQVDLNITTSSLEGVSANIHITVLPVLEDLQVNVSIASPAGTILANKQVNVNELNLNSYIDSEELIDFMYYSPIHAVVAAYKQNLDINNLKLTKDAQGNNQLYISKIAHKKGSALIQFNGFGGSTSSGKNKAWILLYNGQPLVTDLNAPELTDGDQITLYYVENTNESWNYDNVVANKIEGELSETFEITATRQQNNLQNYVVHSSNAPLEDQIYVNGEKFQVNGVDQYTNAEGKASLKFKEEGLKNVSVGEGQLQINVLASGLTPIDQISSIQLYPTIVDDYFTIEQEESNELHVQVIDICGKQLLQQTVGKGKQRVSCNQLHRGMYLVRIQDGSTQYIQKINVR